MFCTLYYQQLFIITRRHRTALRIEKKHNAKILIFRIFTSEPEVCSSHGTYIVKNGLIKVYYVWSTVFR